jgi:hypothetical protein
MEDCIIIPINKDSIKKNPDAGKTQERIVTGQHITFEGKSDVPKIIQDDLDCKNFFISEISLGEDKFYRGLAMHLDDKLIDQLKQEDHTIKIEIHVEYATINHFPSPQYLYEYENIDIKCCICDETFKSDNLESDSFNDDDDYYYSDTVCPKCSAWNCCEVKYESIEEALKCINN